MPRQNVGDLKRPYKRFRDRITAPQPSGVAFETRRSARLEDKIRAQLAREDARWDPSIRDDALRLAASLDPSTPKHVTTATLASASTMWGIRLKLVGAVMALMEENPGEPVSVFTLLPSGPAFLVPTLNGVDPIRLKAIARADLKRCGVIGASGWLILALHGEFDPVSGLYRLHFHGVCAGAMINVVNRLRKTRKYRSKRQGLNALGTATDKPIVISRKPITNLPTTLAYVLQSFWPARSITQSDDGRERKQRKKRRIPSPQHTEVLLWLDQWDFNDIVLLMKIHVTQGRLKPSRQQKSVQFRRNE